ncbi:DUF308 domain-containing protein [uncultured Corynebacterium sp.]|uniref:DUF308 domain-containing protein n=1 Tax=uncultured Corynebacterium sp. TaxID=159447 RepID=UPI0025949D07|nr:DUF308 domain-containing protein [uncultured Corynebacterium sp.]
MARNRDYSDLDSAPRKVTTQDVVVGPRPISKLSLAALLIDILTIPAAILPIFGIPVAMVGIVVGIVAVIRAYRNQTQRSYAIAGLLLAILAMGLAIFFTTVSFQALEGCEDLRGEEFTQCVRDNQ